MTTYLIELEKQLLKHKIESLAKEIEIDKLILIEKNKIKDIYTFITDKTTIGPDRIIERSSKSNIINEIEWQFKHPNNSRTQVRNSTFLGLKKALNQWQPHTLEYFKDNIKKLDFNSEQEKKEFLKMCLDQKEDIDDFHVIQVYRLDYQKQQQITLDEKNIGFKVCIFNKKKQLFYLRSIFNIQWINLINYKKVLSNPSQMENWYIDYSSLMAQSAFWINLKKLINEI